MGMHAYCVLRYMYKFPINFGIFFIHVMGQNRNKICCINGDSTFVFHFVCFKLRLAIWRVVEQLIAGDICSERVKSLDRTNCDEKGCFRILQHSQYECFIQKVPIFGLRNDHFLE